VNDASQPAGENVTDRIDVDDLAKSWAAIDNRRPQMHAELRVGAKTDMGCVRENNEDKFDFLEPEDLGVLATKGRFYGVADGMGGHSAGQIACELALKTVIRAYYTDHTDDIVGSLRQAISEANALIHSTAALIPERQGMGTTFTAAVIRDDKLVLAHLGDSRAYLVRKGEIRQVTQDHSWVAEQVRLGAMNVEEAQASPFRNIITRSLGTSVTVEADFYEEALEEGDILVLCSDGLTGHVSADEIADRVAGADAVGSGPSVNAMRLVERANDRGGRDNITVLIIEVRSITKCSEPETEPEITVARHRTNPAKNPRVKVRAAESG
jgi:serine/threonine protein phosphatase PrpC